MPTGRTIASSSSDPDPDVYWGMAEFVAAEEMERQRGYWWSPDGERIAVARVDDRPVQIWHIASPIDPEAPPRAVRYPRAGTDNAIVTLAIVDMDGGRVDVSWDRDAFPYLVTVDWGTNGPLTLLVESRDQRTMQILGVDPDTGATDAHPRGSRRALARHHDGRPGVARGWTARTHG